MSSSFPLSRFPTLPVGTEKDTSCAVYEDTNASSVEPSDEALLTQVSRADRQALAILFRRHYRLVLWIARKILRNDAEAEDLAQDVFLRIARKAHLYDSSKGTARSWIVGTTYYQALNRKEYLKDRHFYTSVSPKEKDVEMLAAHDANEYDHSGEAVFGRTRWLQMREVLTEDQWEAIRLHFFEGCTFAEIGQRRNIAISNVRHHFYRGLARLRKCIFCDELQGC
jgi:RNA polymerase sigma-70 factor (ECF subfamily)